MKCFIPKSNDGLAVASKVESIVEVEGELIMLLLLQAFRLSTT